MKAQSTLLHSIVRLKALKADPYEASVMQGSTTLRILRHIL